MTGCASLQDELQGKNPPDTAILIGDVPYQISPIACAQIKSIDKDGVLDCHEVEGKRTAKVSPVSNWRRKFLKDQQGLDWATPEH